MKEPTPNWLAAIPGVMLGIKVDPTDPKPAPLTFLLGAGASHSSGGPRTGDILESCRHERETAFDSDEDVYEWFSKRLSARERDRIIRPLFRDTTPYVGYRCLAAMADVRPIFVVNLNWDDYVKCAAEKVGVPFERFDLNEVAKGQSLIEEACQRGRGIVCAHAHGYLADKGEDAPGGGIRFSHPDTNSFKPGELALLEKMLAFTTIVAGTSLVGSYDSHQLVGALLPGAEDSQAGDPEDETENREAEGEENARSTPSSEPFWIFERGPHSLSPGFDTQIAVQLSSALLDRDSLRNFVCDPNVDFDMLLTELRATEIGLRWPQGSPPETQLPVLEKIVPPNPDEVRPLLDQRRSLIVGAPYIGCSTLAFLLAWWQCLVELGDRPDDSPRIKGLQGTGQALEYLERGGLEREDVAAIVIDDIVDESSGAGEAQALLERLATALEQVGDRRVLTTASADAALHSACRPEGATLEVFETTVVRARSLWQPDDLRAWARARGGEQAEVVCREVRMGLISTPSKAIRTYEAHVPHERQEDWRRRLRAHLDPFYRCDSKRDADRGRALALTMLRLQDFSVPRSAAQMTAACGREDHREVLEDPWSLCTPIEVDGEEYLRLSNPGVAGVVDDWMAAQRPQLEDLLRTAGGHARWAVEALAHWGAFRDASEDFDPAELEMFGSEYVKRALEGNDPEAAVRILQQTWESHKDEWTAKDVALDLTLHWEQLKDSAQAWRLRDSLLAAKAPMGAYALFEAILRVGRPVPIELWSATVSKLLDMAQQKNKSESVRRQVALAFDAALWRRCPVSQEQERKLIARLLAGCKGDKCLRAAMAAACAYHHGGAKRLRDDGHRLPLLGTDVDPSQAREIAWLVAWHFVHQSRCRALASRRAFLSTMDGSAAEPHYLDREPRKNQLDEETENEVARLIEALLRHSDTAGWALHLIMNLHATTGTFEVRDEDIRSLHRLLSSEKPGLGVLSAALTYAPTGQVHQLLIGKLKTEGSAAALQEGLLMGVDIEGTRVSPPRFLMGSDPWAIRRRWGAMPERLPFDATTPEELIEMLEARVESAAAEGAVDREDAERAIAVMRRGHTVAAESWQQPSKADPKDVVGLLSFVAAYYSKPEDEW